MTATHLAPLLQLPAQERLQIIEGLWDSLTRQPADLELPAWQAAELDRRLAEYEANPDEGASWAELKQRILART